MSAVKELCPACGDLVYAIDRGHPERCRGPRLRQPTHEPWDWGGWMDDQDADDRRVAPYLSDDMGDDRPPSDRRH